MPAALPNRPGGRVDHPDGAREGQHEQGAETHAMQYRDHVPKRNFRGGQFVAQCGGHGNIDRARRIGEALAASEPYAPHLAGMAREARC